MASSGRFPLRVPLDMTGNQVYNAVMQVLSSAPSSPGVGLYYFDSTLDYPRIWSSTRAAWINLDATKLSNAIPLSALSNIATATILGNNSGSTGSPIALTASQTKALLAIVPGDVTGFDTQVRTSRLDQMAAPAANVSMGGYQLNNVATGVGGTDAVNVTQLNAAVQSAASGIDPKEAVNAATTANITLSGTQTVDGVALTAGQRVLVKNQTTASANGIYLVAAGAWTRTVDGSQGEMTSGAMMLVLAGTTNAGSQWYLSTPDPITVGTTSLTFVQFGVGGTYTAGTNGGLQLTGGAFSVLTPTGGGVVTDSTGTHIDTTVVTRKYATTLTTSATSYTVTHGLGTSDVVVQLVNLTTGDIEQTSVNIPNTTTVTIAFSVAPTANQYRVIVQG